VTERLCLLRHGIAIDRDAVDAPAEEDRWLTGEGERKTIRAALGLRAMGVRPNAMICSPYRRAVQTAELAAACLGFPVEEIELTSALEPEASPAAIRVHLGLLDGEVLAVGHAPNLDRVIASLLEVGTDVTALKKAGAAMVDVVGKQLVWVATAGMLRAMSSLGLDGHHDRRRRSASRPGS
jgi:phosphohistidine phosphatase